MNSDWLDFLTKHGASVASGLVQHFGNLALELNSTAEGTVFCDLSQFGTLRVSGEDAQSFLQNLLSNDMNEVSDSRAQLSSLNDAKGRLLATMLVSRVRDAFVLQLPRVLCDAIRKKLALYVLRAKVNIADASDEIVSVGLSGPNIPAILPAPFGELPGLRFGVIPTALGETIKIDAMRWQINTHASQASSLWSALSERGRPVGSECWDWLNIRSGIPVILPQTQEQLVAQMANLELIGGVSFKKGCYPGQEIVARMQYLGKPKRRMYLAHLGSREAPQAGDKLFSADMGNQASGMIVNAAHAPKGGYDVLASVQTSSRQTQTVHWKTLTGDSLQFLPMPYPLSDD